MLIPNPFPQTYPWCLFLHYLQQNDLDHMQFSLSKAVPIFSLSMCCVMVVYVVDLTSIQSHLFVSIFVDNEQYP